MSEGEYPGHRYRLRHLDGEGCSWLQFVQRAPLHPAVEGVTCQEVLRAVIDRVVHLDSERPWDGNASILSHLRQALAGFEARAILRKAERGAETERWPVGEDGHIPVRAHLATDGGKTDV